MINHARTSCVEDCSQTCQPVEEAKHVPRGCNIRTQDHTHSRSNNPSSSDLLKHPSTRNNSKTRMNMGMPNHVLQQGTSTHHPCRLSITSMPEGGMSRKGKGSRR